MDGHAGKRAVKYIRQTRRELALEDPLTLGRDLSLLR